MVITLRDGIRENGSLQACLEKRKNLVQKFSTGQCIFGGCQVGRLYPVTLGLLSSFYLLYHCVYVYTCMCTHTHRLMEDVKCIGFLRAEDLLRISFMSL